MMEFIQYRLVYRIWTPTLSSGAPKLHLLHPNPGEQSNDPPFWHLFLVSFLAPSASDVTTLRSNGPLMLPRPPATAPVTRGFVLFSFSSSNAAPAAAPAPSPASTAADTAVYRGPAAFRAATSWDINAMIPISIVDETAAMFLYFVKMGEQMLRAASGCIITNWPTCRIK